MKIRDIVSPHNFDVGYILPPSFGAAASFKLAGVKERIGYIADGRRLLLTRPLPLTEPINATHRAEAYFNLLRRGARVDLEFTRPKIFINDEDSQAAFELLQGFDVGSNDDYVVIAFRAVAESRRWGTTNYAALASRIVREYGFKVVLVGTGADSEEGEKLIQMVAHEHTVNLAGKTSLRELAAIFSRAVLFVGNDSGPAHLAAAVGIPLVVISGADDPRETSPLSPYLQRVRVDHLDCIGCVKNVCPLRGEQFMKCQKDISVDMVAAAVSQLIQSR
jgi:heptosyltransferase-2